MQHATPRDSMWLMRLELRRFCEIQALRALREPILGAIDGLNDAVKTGDLSSASAPFLQVVLSVGGGVLVGVFLIGNLVKVLLDKYEQATLGALLGLLVGAVFVLWPLQRGVAPKLGDTFKGQVVTPEIADRRSLGKGSLWY